MGEWVIATNRARCRDCYRCVRICPVKAVREARFGLEKGDYIALVSDGYEHAGVGGLYRLGWGWNNIAISAKRWCQTDRMPMGLPRPSHAPVSSSMADGM